MLGFRCSSWEVAGGYFFTQHAVKPCNSFPQATAGTDSIPVISCTCAGNCHKGLLPLQLPAAKREVSRFWVAGILGMLEERVARLTGCPWSWLGGRWIGWDRCRCPP